MVIENVKVTHQDILGEKKIITGELKEKTPKGITIDTGENHITIYKPNIIKIEHKKTW